jgi:GNAT superfamily N-acetyltransferase
MIAEASAVASSGDDVAMTAPRIRPMVAADVDAATDLILGEEWGDRRTWFEFAASQPECRPIVAEIDDEIVGTGVGTANGAVGWVGTIFVATAHRRAGLGRALTEAVCEDLAAAGCRTLVLVSTSEGLPLYQHLGFELQTHYRILEAPGLAGGGPAGPDVGQPRVRPFEPADLDEMTALDATATGEDRAHALRRFATPTSAKVLAGPDGSVAGFVVRAPWGGGATIATDPDGAMRILEARRIAAGPTGRVRVGLVEENAAGLARLEREGLHPVWSAPRLIRGEPLTWRPDWIWGQLNHAMG